MAKSKAKSKGKQKPPRVELIVRDAAKWTPGEVVDMAHWLATEMAWIVIDHADYGKVVRMSKP